MSITLKRYFLALLFCFSVCSAYASDLSTVLRSYEARYTVLWRGVNVGESTHRLSKLGPDRYQLVSKAEPNIPFIPYSFEENSEFQVQGEQIFPIRYAYNNKEGVTRKKGALTFDWPEKMIRNTRKKDWTATLEEGMTDKQTHTLMLRRDLLSGKTEDLSYPVVLDGKIRDYSFSILGSETVKCALGTLNTLKLEQLSSRGRRRSVFWLSPEHDYLLVKMEQSWKGKQVGGGEILSYTPF